MMKPGKLIKTLTIIGFISLITILIAFKSGMFEENAGAGYKVKIPEGNFSYPVSEEKKPERDTMPKPKPVNKIDSPELGPRVPKKIPYMMSTSKSFIIIDQKPNIVFDKTLNHFSKRITDTTRFIR